MLDNNTYFSLSLIQNEVIRNTYDIWPSIRVINGHVNFDNIRPYKNSIISDEAYNVITPRLQSGFNYFLNYAHGHIGDFLNNRYFIILSTGCTMDIESDYSYKNIHGTWSNIANHKYGSGPVKKIKSYYESFNQKTSFYYHHLCNCNNYIIFKLLQTDETRFYDNIIATIDKYSEIIDSNVCEYVREKAKTKDIEAYVVLILFALFNGIGEFNSEDLLDKIKLVASTADSVNTPLHNVADKVTNSSKSTVPASSKATTDSVIAPLENGYANIIFNTGARSWQTLGLLRDTANIDKNFSITTEGIIDPVKVNGYKTKSISLTCDATTDVYSLLAAADIYVSQKDFNKAFYCSLYAYTLGEHKQSSFNMGYYFYRHIIRRHNGDPNEHFSQTINYFGVAFDNFSEAAKLGHPAAINSLGNLTQMLIRLSANEFVLLRHIETARNIIEFAHSCKFISTKVYDSFIRMISNFSEACHTTKDIDIEDINYIKDECLAKIREVFYKKAADLGNYDAMYSCIRDEEKKIRDLVADSIKINKPDRITKKYIKSVLKNVYGYQKSLIAVNHPRGINSFCCYLIATLDDFESKYEDGDFTPPWMSELNAKQKDTVVKEFKTTIGEEGAKDNDIITKVLDLYRSVLYVGINELMFFWPIFHYVFLYNAVNKGEPTLIHRYKNQNPEATYEYLDMIELLETALRPSIMDKEIFKAERRIEVQALVASLLLEILAAAKNDLPSEVIIFHCQKNARLFVNCNSYQDQKHKRALGIDHSEDGPFFMGDSALYLMSSQMSEQISEMMSKIDLLLPQHNDNPNENEFSDSDTNEISFTAKSK